MAHLPRGETSREYLARLWREHSERYAGHDGNIEGQIVVASYSAVEALTSLCKTLDSDDRYHMLIHQRFGLFREGRDRAATFPDALVTGTFSLYNTLNTLCRQLSEDTEQASGLISRVDEQVHECVELGTKIAGSAAALRGGFPLLTLATIMLDRNRTMTHVVRQVEQRFSAASKLASSDWEQLLNALYRLVEMTQIFALLADPVLEAQINQIAGRFKEEDQARELKFKLRNGFCRLFELGHLAAARVDEML